MSNKSSLWCVWKKCNNNVMEKRHFFLFPKEHDRWLQWINACGRLDLTVMSPEYAHRNYRLCHLHFEDKWYKIGKSRAYLHPDAIPTIFFEKNNTRMTTAEKQMENIQQKNNMENKEKRTNSESIGKNQQQKEINSNIQSSKAISMDVDIAKSNIFNSRDSAAVKGTQKKKQKQKLKERNLKKLIAKNKMLRERIRQLQKKMRKP